MRIRSLPTDPAVLGAALFDERVVSWFLIGSSLLLAVVIAVSRARA